MPTAPRNTAGGNAPGLLALQRLVEAVRDQGSDTLPWLRGAAGWAKSALESLPKLIPGAEKVKEALEIVLNGIDTMEAIRGRD